MRERRRYQRDSDVPGYDDEQGAVRRHVAGSERLIDEANALIRQAFPDTHVVDFTTASSDALDFYQPRGGTKASSRTRTSGCTTCVRAASWPH